MHRRLVEGRQALQGTQMLHQDLHLAFRDKLENLECHISGDIVLLWAVFDPELPSRCRNLKAVR